MSKQSRVFRFNNPNIQIATETAVALVVGLICYSLFLYLDIGEQLLKANPAWSKVSLIIVFVGLFVMATLIAIFCSRAFITLFQYCHRPVREGNSHSTESCPREVSPYCTNSTCTRDPVRGFERPVTRKNILMCSMRQAIEKEEFEVLYQPICGLTVGSRPMLEALCRWKHPHLGLILPGEFIPIAEETGLIVPLGLWVLRTACMDLKELLTRGFDYLGVSVNISPVQLMDRNLDRSIERILEEAGLDPEYLMLELTETGFIENPEILRMLQNLHKLGVRMALDDFGTGYSSYSKIKDLPIQSMKIDRSLISGVNTSTKDVIIVHSIIRMAHALGIRVVAEGVESDGQYRILQRLGCDMGQGYLLGYPEIKGNIACLVSASDQASIPYQCTFDKFNFDFKP